jgi:hypothetical protein
LDHLVQVVAPVSDNRCSNKPDLTEHIIRNLLVIKGLVHQNRNCLQNGEGVPIDLNRPALYFILAADQAYAAAQFDPGKCLREGEGFSKHFKGTALYFKLATDQSLAAAQYCDGICLITDDTFTFLQTMCCCFKIFSNTFTFILAIPRTSACDRTALSYCERAGLFDRPLWVADERTIKMSIVVE